MKKILDGSEFNWTHLLAHLFIGAVTGVSMAKVASLLGLPPDAQHVASAWGGVIGLKAFEFVTEFIANKVSATASIVSGKIIQLDEQPFWVVPESKFIR